MNDEKKIFEGLDKAVFEQRTDSAYQAKFKAGLSEDLVRKISAEKNEPEWMLEFRLKSLRKFLEMDLPKWGPDLSPLNFDEITYFASAVDSDKQNATKWEDVPEDIKNTFERLGIPLAERKMLAGAGAQFESDVVYHSLKKEWESQGVIFEDASVALVKYPDLFKQYFMKCVPFDDHKFAALHAAVWSGGTFLYVPKGVKVSEPVQAYFRMNAPGQGQFEHTIIVLEESAEAHYIEGCSAPKYGYNALHAGCVEIYVGENARMRYSSVENWSKDTYNLNTKRAMVKKDAFMEWVGGNMGSAVTMLYPCSILQGEGSRADHLGIAFANEGQVQDTGAKIIHLASNTSSKVLTKSLSKDGGVSSYRGLIKVMPNLHNVTVQVDCDALILDDQSVSDTVPVMDIRSQDVTVVHEAKVGKLNQDDLFYLMSRGIDEEAAKGMIVNGFIEPIVKELPMEYAVEMNRLIELELE